LLAQMEGVTALLSRLLYGTGMRLMEGIRLRVKDVDFDRLVIIVREAKGNKDRVVMLPRSLVFWRAFANRCPFTPCAIRLPHICFRRAPTSARYKNCWATRMSAPR